MKVEDANKLLEKMKAQADLEDYDPFLRNCIDEMSEMVFQLSQTLQFYANRNYDDGLVARMVLGQMTRRDEQMYAIHANNTFDLRCEENDA